MKVIKLDSKKDKFGDGTATSITNINFPDKKNRHYVRGPTVNFIEDDMEEMPFLAFNKEGEEYNEF
jgi:hypothetical protein